MIRAGVLGSPIAHSLSPILHTTAYNSLGIKGEYSAYEVSSGGLKGFLSGVGKDLDCLSLTMPLKEEAITFAAHISEISQKISSGNTLYRKFDGWHLTSTDVEGFSYALTALGDFPRENILVIGAGATARAVVAACDNPATNLTIINRSMAREHSIRKSALTAKINFVDWESEVDLNDYDLVVNTTPGNTAAEFAKSLSSPRGILFEVIYNPWPTDLLRSWKDCHGQYVDGLDLLVHQAISQIEIFSNQKIDRFTMAQLLRTEGLKSLR